MLAIGYAILAMWFTVLPPEINMALWSIDVDRLMGPRTVGRAVMIVAGAAAVMLALMAWQRRHDWRAQLSWPLLGWLALCLVGLAMLILLSQPPERLARYGLAWLAGLSDEFDLGHIVAYLGFAAVAAFAWRDRLSLPAIGVLLMAYGFALELAQEFVPTRRFRINDLVSNGLGISFGLAWVYLYDLLHDSKGRTRGRAGTRVSTGEPPGALAGRALGRGSPESGSG